MPGSSSGDAAARLPELIAIGDRRRVPGGDWDGWVEALAAAGVAALQVREKDLADRALLELVRRARAALPPPALVLVNGRADVALAGGADGVHLPARGVAVEALRRRFAGLLLLGRSTHAVAEVEAAAAAGADYVVFGPVWATPGKERYGPPAGVAALARAAAVGIPVYALGGVTIDRLAAVAAAGARGAAAIRMFLDPERLAEAVAAGRRAFAGAPSRR